MAERFTAGGRTYTDTPAGRLLAARDKADDSLRLRGHDMMHWRKNASAQPPCFTARCGKCSGGVKIVTGRAPMKDPGYPSLVRFGKVTWCPGKGARR